MSMDYELWFRGKNVLVKLSGRRHGLPMFGPSIGGKNILLLV
jgi:hypothetical protein